MLQTLRSIIAIVMTALVVLDAVFAHMLRNQVPSAA